MKFNLFCISSLLILISAGNVHAAPETQPNILWIVTDDQRPDSLQAYNRAVYGTDHSPLGYVESPTADALAAEGTLFVNAFNNAPACGPSRGSFHAGRYPFRHGHYAFELTHQEPDFVRPTVTQFLRNDYGYTAATFGKADSYIFRWGPGQGFHDPGKWDHRVHFKNDLQKQGLGDLFANTAYTEDWTKLGVAEWAHTPDGRVRQHFFSRVDGPVTDEDRRVRAEIEEEFDILRSYTRFNKNLILGGVNPMPANETVDARVVREFKNYLKKPGRPYKTLWGKPVVGPDPDKPLLMHLGFHLPHTPVLPPKSVRDRFQQHKYKVPKFSLAEVEKLPAQLKHMYQTMTANDYTDAEKQQAIQDYYAFCAHGDALLADAVEAFKTYTEKQGRPWLIVYAVGDHGWHLGEQGIMAKFGPWQQSVNNAVILVSSDKDLVPAGAVHRGIVEYVDLAPTILQAAGADLSEKKLSHLDGFSLTDTLHGQAPARDYAVGEMSLVIGHRAYLLTDRFRFSMKTRPFPGKIPADKIGENIKWALNAPVEKVDLALYDLESDPLERRNVADHPRYRELAAFLRDKLGRVVLGDGRVEVDWSKANTYTVSDFAEGAHDYKLEIPEDLIPQKLVAK
ncbi:MAG: sulfatase-like hydrolase/transferase [Planctomycetota bacterium]